MDEKNRPTHQCLPRQLGVKNRQSPKICKLSVLELGGCSQAEFSCSKSVIIRIFPLSRLRRPNAGDQCLVLCASCWVTLSENPQGQVLRGELVQSFVGCAAVSLQGSSAVLLLADGGIGDVILHGVLSRFTNEEGRVVQPWVELLLMAVQLHHDMAYPETGFSTYRLALTRDRPEVESSYFTGRECVEAVEWRERVFLESEIARTLGQRIQADLYHHNRGCMVRSFKVADRVWIKRATEVGVPKLHTR